MERIQPAVHGEALLDRAKPQQAQGVDRKRPLCTYPLIAKWSGTGDPTKAENFACVNP